MSRVPPRGSLASTTLRNWRGASVQFFIEECGAGGDCLFSALAVAFTRLSRHGRRYDARAIRKWIASTIHESTLPEFVKQVLPKARDKSLIGVQEIVRTLGWTCIGTDDFLQWIASHARPEMGYVVLTQHGADHLAVLHEPGRVQHYIFLYNNGFHWQLVHVFYRGRYFVCLPKRVVEDLFLKKNK